MNQQFTNLKTLTTIKKLIRRYHIFLGNESLVFSNANYHKFNKTTFLKRVVYLFE